MRASKPRITQYVEGIRVPPSPYVPPSVLDTSDYNRIFGTCELGSKGFCINSNLERFGMKKIGRMIRAPQTYRGQFHWSELTEDSFGNPVWGQFVCNLKPWYAKQIDKFDTDGAMFKLPRRDPYGPVQFVSVCVPRVDTSEQRKERRARVTAKAAKLGRRKIKAREPQFEYALELNA